MTKPLNTSSLSALSSSASPKEAADFLGTALYLIAVDEEWIVENLASSVFLIDGAPKYVQPGDRIAIYAAEPGMTGSAGSTPSIIAFARIIDVETYTDPSTGTVRIKTDSRVFLKKVIGPYQMGQYFPGWREPQNGAGRLVSGAEKTYLEGVYKEAAAEIQRLEVYGRPVRDSPEVNKAFYKRFFEVEYGFRRLESEPVWSELYLSDRVLSRLLLYARAGGKRLAESGAESLPVITEMATAELRFCIFLFIQIYFGMPAILASGIRLASSAPIDFYSLYTIYYWGGKLYVRSFLLEFIDEATDDGGGANEMTAAARVDKVAQNLEWENTSLPPFLHKDDDYLKGVSSVSHTGAFVAFDLPAQIRAMIEVIENREPVSDLLMGTPVDDESSFSIGGLFEEIKDYAAEQMGKAAREMDLPPVASIDQIGLSALKMMQSECAVDVRLLPFFAGYMPRMIAEMVMLVPFEDKHKSRIAAKHKTAESRITARLLAAEPRLQEFLGQGDPAAAADEQMSLISFTDCFTVGGGRPCPPPSSILDMTFGQLSDLPEAINYIADLLFAPPLEDVIDKGTTAVVAADDDDAAADNPAAAPSIAFAHTRMDQEHESYYRTFLQESIILCTYVCFPGIADWTLRKFITDLPHLTINGDLVFPRLLKFSDDPETIFDPHQ